MGAHTAHITRLLVPGWIAAWLLAHRWLPGASGPAGLDGAMPAALTVAGALFLGWWAAPTIAIAAATADLVLWPTDAPTLVTVALALAHGSIYVAAGVALRRRDLVTAHTSTGDLARFGIVAVAASGIHAVIGSLVLVLGDLIDWDGWVRSSGEWMVDDVTGIAVLVALPFSLYSTRAAAARYSVGEAIRSAGASTVVRLTVQLATLVASVAVAAALAGADHYPLYLAGGALAWIAVSGFSSAALGVAVLGACVLVDVAAGGLATRGLVVELQAAALAALTLAIGAQADDRRRAAALFRRMTAELRLSEALHRAVVEGAEDGIVVIDPDGRIQTANGAASRIFGYDANELAGLRIATLVPGDSEDRHQVAYLLESSRDETSGRYLDARRADGTHFPIRLTVSKIVVDGQVAYSAIVRDESARKSFEDLLEYQATHDPLTGLPNRTLFNDRLRMALERQRRDGGPIAVLLVDLDRFKTVNDTLGHDVGDRVLIDAADRLRRSVRRSDTIARLGGDEFVVLCSPLSDDHEAENVARRIVTSMSRRFEDVPNDLDVTASVGVRVTRYPNEEPGRLLRDADAALYTAKRAGRNRYRVQRTERVDATATWIEMDLRQALRENQLTVHYQPILSLSEKRVVGVEALVRLRRRTGELAYPDAFIPVAERVGLIGALGEQVIARACADLARVREETGDANLAVAVNISPRQLSNDEIVETIARSLALSALPPSALSVELTESVGLDNIAGASEQLRQLSDLGVQIALDDFGTGHASLSRLRDLPVDLLKIDKSFVTNMLASQMDHDIVTAVITLAERQGLAVIAEGVETPEHADELGRLGCDLLQGFLFSRALDADELTRTLRNWQRTGIPTGRAASTR